MNVIINTILIIMLTTPQLETPNYQVVKKYKNFEIRDYSQMVIAYTTANQSYKESTYTGFRRIANYIFGGNEQGTKIAMTAPVVTKLPDANTNNHEIFFVMPSKHTFESLPKPNLETVTLAEKQLGRVAVFTFGAWATENRSKYYTEKLKKLLNKNNVVFSDGVMIAQYNSPWALPPFRKNEIIIPIKSPQF